METGTISSSTEKNKNENVPISPSQKFFFSLGHISNDLGITIWFTYMLIFFIDVANISSVQAGFLMFVGQFLDAITTLAVGYESDRIDGFFGYTKRKSWHLIGTVMTNLSFPFFFLPVLGGSRASDFAKVIYYAPICAIYAIGWAFVQISHLTLVSELTPDEAERVSLNGFRHGMTLMANVIVYCLVWFVFDKPVFTQWSPNNAFGFMIIAFTIVFVGSFCSIFFHICTKEHGHKFHSKQKNLEPNKKMLWQDWFNEITFYLIGVAYIGARLVVVILQGYMPFYVTYTLHLSMKYSAIIPMMVFVSGFFTSILMSRITNVFGKKLSLLLGSLVMTAGILWIYFINESNSLQIFGPAIFNGIGSTILFITTLSMISDMIGSNTNSSAFVFGVLSFVEKSSTGAAIMVIQSIQPVCGFDNKYAVLDSYYKTVMTWVLLACTLVCFLSFFALIPFTIGDLRKFKKASEDSEEEKTATTSFIK